MNYNIPRQVSRNFQLKEFLEVSESLDIQDWEPFFVYLLPWLQQLRDHSGLPIKITSFHRSSIGVQNSTHFKSMAVDFTVPANNGNLEEQVKIYNNILSLHPHIRVCLYKDNDNRNHFYHMDCGRIYYPDQYTLWHAIED